MTEETTILRETPSSGDIHFNTASVKDILVIRDNGDFLVQGRLVTNDMEVYEAMKEFLYQFGFIKNGRRKYV